MTIASNLQRIIGAKAAIRQAIIDKGVEVPDTEKIDTYHDYIDQIGGGGGYDPNNPTLEGLKAALDAGDYAAFPTGTEIPDTYADNDSPLIVAQYLNNTNNEKYDGAEGVILIRKYVEPTSQVFNNNTSLYDPSAIRTFLASTYYGNCSEYLKTLMSSINIPYYNGSTMTSVPSKWFLMSAYEVCDVGARGSASYEGQMWDYWKEKTGLSYPDSMLTSNGGRVMKDRSGAAQAFWLRSLGTYMSTTNYTLDVANSGLVRDRKSNLDSGVLPACFIAKSTSGGGT